MDQKFAGAVMFKIIPNGMNDVLTIQSIGRLTHKDYRGLAGLLDQTVEMEGAISMMFDMREFKGMTPQAMFDDFILGIRHSHSFNYVAIVGNQKWEKWAAKVAGLIISADVQYFEENEFDAAWRWVCKGQKKLNAA